MEPMYLSIRTKETGQKIKRLLMENGYNVRDIQEACGLKIHRRFINGFPEGPYLVHRFVNNYTIHAEYFSESAGQKT